MWRDYWLSLSFANLVYLRAWSDLFPPGPDDLFYRKTLPGIDMYIGIAGDVLAFSFLVFLLTRLAPRLPSWLKRVLLVVAAVMVAWAVHSVAPRGFLRSRVLGLPELGLVCAVFALMAFRFAGRAFKLAQTVVLAATPCIAVTFAGSLLDLHFQPPLPPDPPLASRLSGSPPVRVLWIIFDEWDQRLSFPKRAPETSLPVLDHLASRSFAATRALAPLAGMAVADMTTADAVPSLLYGRRGVASEIEGATTRHIDFGDGSPTLFGAGNSVFAQARASGWNTAVAGWYLPYCRVFNPQLTDCFWDQIYDQRESARSNIAGAAVDETKMLLETRMFSAFGPSIANTRHVAEYQALLSTARRYAADPAIGLAFIHFNIPHIPYFYDPKIGRLGRYGFSASLYNSALERVDRCVGEILSAIDSAGLQSKTAIIFSSDHPERNFTADPWVPFIVHLPGEEYGLISTQEFSTLKTASLAIAIARGDAKTPADIAAFLRTSGPGR